VRVLIVNQYFPPEVEPSATKIHEVSREWVRSGLSVTVITGMPNYPSGVIRPGYRHRLWRVERVDGVRVIRVFAIPASAGSFVRRVLGHLSFMVSAGVASLFAGECDVVVASSPPLEVGLVGLAVARSRRRPFVFEVRDLWPDAAISFGIIRNRSIIKLARLAERICYRHASRVVVVSPGFVDHVLNHGVSRGNVKIIINGTDTFLFRPRRERDPLLKELFRNGKHIVLYAGTFGLQQNLITVLKAAALLKGTPDIGFVLVGDGCDRGKLERARAEWRLRNVVILPLQSRRRVASLISSADICLVQTGRCELNLGNLPAKLFDYMACGRPIVIAGKGQARMLVEKAGAGTAAEPDDPESLCRAVLALTGNQAQRECLGRNGRRFALVNCSRQIVAGRYLSLLDDVVNDREGRSSGRRFSRRRELARLEV